MRRCALDREELQGYGQSDFGGIREPAVGSLPWLRTEPGERLDSGDRAACGVHDRLVDDVEQRRVGEDRLDPAPFRLALRNVARLACR